MYGVMISNRGGRESNEDAIGKCRIGSVQCFALADGMGGHENGETASKLAVNTIIECFKAQPEISKDVVFAYLEAAQNVISEQRSIQKNNMGTTAAVLVTDGVDAVWAHCGDSRIYRLKGSLIQEVTDDHSVAFASFAAGEIKYSDIRYSPDQNRLIHSLGDGKSFKAAVSDVVKLPKKSSFLLCTDGFWEYVTEDFIEKSRKRTSGAREWLTEMTAELKRNAPENSDNYSAIAVNI